MWSFEGWSRSLQGHGIWGVEGGVPVIGMTTQLGMRRGFSGWNSGDQLVVYLVAMQISWYSYIDTQSSCYFLMVCLQTYIMINRIETCLIIVIGEVSIASYNCNGSADNKKRRSVFTCLKEKEYHIYCLKETHSTILDEVLWKKDWGSEIYFSHEQRNSKGVIILINSNVDPNVQIVQTDPQGRWMISKMLLCHKRI